jgi:prevent-host-death family protein
MHWQLQEAKNKLSHVVREAQTHGPQTITLRGKDAVVLISVAHYRRLTEQRDSLLDFLRHSPWAEVELDMERSGDTGRNIEL